MRFQIRDFPTHGTFILRLAADKLPTSTASTSIAMASSRSTRTFHKSRGWFVNLPRHRDTAKSLDPANSPLISGMKRWWNLSESKHRPNVVLVHGAWTDGSSWNKTIRPLLSKGLNVLAAPIPMTSLSDDVAALDRALERTDGPVVLAAHAMLAR